VNYSYTDSEPMLYGYLATCEISMQDVLRFFFFQAEDGIRDYKVTGVQTCALPISIMLSTTAGPARMLPCAVAYLPALWPAHSVEIGRASCRERAQVSQVVNAI